MIVLEKELDGKRLILLNVRYYRKLRELIFNQVPTIPKHFNH
jgi:hypothetical protein